MNEYEKRKAAIQRRRLGEKISVIVASLGKSRQWFYNWLKRFQTLKDDEWYLDYSKAPKIKPAKISEAIEEQVLEIRQDLESQHYAQTGASYSIRISKKRTTATACMDDQSDYCTSRTEQTTDEV